MLQVYAHVVSVVLGVADGFADNPRRGERFLRAEGTAAGATATTAATGSLLAAPGLDLGLHALNKTDDGIIYDFRAR